VAFGTLFARHGIVSAAGQFASKFETVDKRDDIQHPGVRGCLQYLGIDEGFEINHAGDLPARSGLGSHA